MMVSPQSQVRPDHESTSNYINHRIPKVLQLPRALRTDEHTLSYEAFTPAVAHRARLLHHASAVLWASVMDRANVLGVGVHAIDIAQGADRIECALVSGERGYVCVTGVHGVMEAQNDPEFKAILNGSLLTAPDGMPTVWVGRLQGFRRMKRVFGPDLMLELCARSAQKGYTHFLYGGAPGVAEQLKHALLSRFPGINVVGTYTPPFRPLTQPEFWQLKDTISALQPDLFWVGLSTPKQERFMAACIHQLAAKVMIGVGAAFDIHAGRLRDAPSWVKNLGLQWIHRLLQEPTRLWKRYLINNPTFMWRIALQLTGAKHYVLT
jgi:N-acetylglucosaminyldiphosphoundecaprenol N-acetyl-beta-D-mannosaminyltransferase